jgi:hypothetical protein
VLAGGPEREGTGSLSPMISLPRGRAAGGREERAVPPALLALVCVGKEMTPPLDWDSERSVEGERWLSIGGFILPRETRRTVLTCKYCTRYVQNSPMLCCDISHLGEGLCHVVSVAESPDAERMTIFPRASQLPGSGRARGTNGLASPALCRSGTVVPWYALGGSQSSLTCYSVYVQHCR